MRRTLLAADMMFSDGTLTDSHWSMARRFTPIDLNLLQQQAPAGSPHGYRTERPADPFHRTSHRREGGVSSLAPPSRSRRCPDVARAEPMPSHRRPRTLWHHLPAALVLLAACGRGKAAFKGDLRAEHA